MDENRLNEILDKHKKWLNGEESGERADLHDSILRGSNLSGSDMRDSNLRYSNLRDSNLRYSNLRYSDLSYSDLSGSDMRDSDMRDSNLRYSDLSYSDLSGSDMRGSDMRGSDLDYSVWPLWCGSLKAHVDDHIAIQLLYHTLSVVQHSPYVSDELKRALLTPGNIDAANRFHHVGECGTLEVYNDGNTI